MLLMGNNSISMEGLVKVKILISLLFLSSSISAQDKDVLDKVMYVKSLFAQVHKNPSKYSNYMTTVECGHPVKVYKKVSKKGDSVRILFNRTWHLVKVGAYDGYMNAIQLSSKKGECFQDNYPKFYDSVDISINEMFYWGKLYDQYVTGKSRVR